MKLIDNAEVQKFFFQGNYQQTLAGADQALKTMEVWRLALAPGSNIPPSRHPGEVVVLTMQGTGRVLVDDKAVEIRPDTTLVIPPNAARQVANTGTGELVLLLVRSLVTS